MNSDAEYLVEITMNWGVSVAILSSLLFPVCMLYLFGTFEIFNFSWFNSMIVFKPGISLLTR